MVSPRFAMCHISELTNPFLPLPPLHKANPHFQHAMFPTSPTSFSSFFTLLPSPPSPSPPAISLFFCNMPPFQPHHPLPLPPSPRKGPFLQHATFLSSPTCSSLFLPSSK